MSTLKKDILGKIEKEDISPKPKWWFIVGHVLLWALFITTILIGALAFGMLLFELFASDRELLEFLRSSGLHPRRMSLLPFVWVLLGIITVVVSYIFFRSTSTGYRHSAWKMVTILMVSSVVVGAALYVTRISEFADDRLSGHPLYQEIREQVRDTLIDPENGALGGVFIQSEDEQIFIIRDREGSEWIITFVCETPECDMVSQNPPVDRPILLLGEKTGELTFEVHDSKRPERPGIIKIFENRGGSRKGRGQRPPLPTQSD